MSNITINQSTIDDLVFNGKDVDKLIVNGEVVWELPDAPVQTFNFIKNVRDPNKPYAGYINTGYIPTENTEVQLSFSQAGTNTWSVFGTRKANTQKHLQFMAPQSTNGSVRFNFGNKNYTINRINFSEEGDYTIKINKSGVWSGTSQLTSWSPSDMNFELPIVLFGLNNNGTIEHAGNQSSVKPRVYWLKIYEQDVLVRNFVPAKKGNRVGFYDEVNQTFYGNEYRDGILDIGNSEISTYIGTYIHDATKQKWYGEFGNSSYISFFVYGFKTHFDLICEDFDETAEIDLNGTQIVPEFYTDENEQRHISITISSTDFKTYNIIIKKGNSGQNAKFYFPDSDFFTRK